MIIHVQLLGRGLVILNFRLQAPSQFINWSPRWSLRIRFDSLQLISITSKFPSVSVRVLVWFHKRDESMSWQLDLHQPPCFQALLPFFQVGLLGAGEAVISRHGALFYRCFGGVRTDPCKEYATAVDELHPWPHWA
jgi:hypothetical protein